MVDFIDKSGKENRSKVLMDYSAFFLSILSILVIVVSIFFYLATIQTDIAVIKTKQEFFKVQLERVLSGDETSNYSKNKGKYYGD